MVLMSKSVLLTRDPSTPNEERLWSAFEAASKSVKGGMTTAKGGSGVEDKYKLAYQDLMREGLVMPIKKKYRG